MAKFCTKCGNELNDSNFCEKCGAKNEDANTNNAGTVQINQTIVTKPKSNGFATAGFIISLVSLLCCGSTSTFGLIFSIIGLVTAKKYDGNGKGLAIAGIIISSISVILLILFYVLGIAASFIDTINTSNSYSSSIY